MFSKRKTLAFSATMLSVYLSLVAFVRVERGEREIINPTPHPPHPFPSVCTHTPSPNAHSLDCARKQLKQGERLDLKQEKRKHKGDRHEILRG